MDLCIHWREGEVGETERSTVNVPTHLFSSFRPRLQPQMAPHLSYCLLFTTITPTLFCQDSVFPS